MFLSYDLWKSLHAAPVAYNPEKIIDPEGNFQLGLAFYEEILGGKPIVGPIPW